MKKFVMAATAVAFTVFATPSHATQNQGQIVTCDFRGCSDQVHNASGAPVEHVSRVRRGHSSPSARRSAPRAAYAALNANGNAVVLGGRPHGCPYQFCGCEASLYVFGEIRKELNLAYNWVRKFPRAHPAPGMAAARWGHVMVLVRHVTGSNWVVHDGNSGGHLTRQHVRSINGYTIVDPHGSRQASNGLSD